MIKNRTVIWVDHEVHDIHEHELKEKDTFETLLRRIGRALDNRISGLWDTVEIRLEKVK